MPERKKNKRKHESVSRAHVQVCSSTRLRRTEFRAISDCQRRVRSGEDDYFNAVGSFESVQSLMGTMECAVKSPRMVEGFRAFPPEKRPTLRQAETGNAAAYYSPACNEIVMGEVG